MDDDQLLARITTSADTMAGQPVIAGTRLTVAYILNLLAHGATEAEILDEYDRLERADLRACLLFGAKALADASFMPLRAA
jgi:uncharacterized protein (DUF433 family)